jgi:hypothetical protein
VHDPCAGLGARKGAADIHGADVVQHRHGRIEEGDIARDPDGRGEEVEPPERARTASAMPATEYPSEASTASGTAASGRRAGLRRSDDGRALPGEAACDGGTEAGGAARDDGLG